MSLSMVPVPPPKPMAIAAAAGEIRIAAGHRCALRGRLGRRWDADRYYRGGFPSRAPGIRALRREYTLSVDSATLHRRFSGCIPVRLLDERSKSMLSRRLVVQAAILGFWSAALFAQQRPAPSPRPALHQFALTLQQTIESGKTKIGTKVQAKLAAATVFDGTVIPRNAVFSGVVIESTAKSGKDPAKLAIRLETAEWKGGSTSMTAYLTPLYYAMTAAPVQNLANGSPDGSSRTLNDAGQDPSSDSPMNRPFPGSESQKSQAAIPEVPMPPNRPVPMKNVVIALADEGGAALASEHANIKLYKMTTYVFAAAEATVK